eukprot:gene23592-9120_t
MANRLVVLTGGSIGSVGFHCAKLMVEQGHRVVVASRDVGRGQAAVKELNKSSTAAGAQANFVQMDLASLSSVRRAAKELLDTYPKIDVLVCNAGIVPAKIEAAEDGWENTLTTNHLGHFLLTHMLLPALKRADSARVVVVASGLHDNGIGPQFNNPGMLFSILDKKLDEGGEEFKPTMMQLYSITKLVNVWFTYHLAKMLPSTITCNTADGMTGKYFARGELTPSSALSHDAEQQKSLCELSCKATGISEAEYLSFGQEDGTVAAKE